MPKSKKKVNVRDQAPAKDPKGGRHGNHHNPQGGTVGNPGGGPGHPVQ